MVRNTLQIKLRPGVTNKEPRAGKITKLFEKVFQIYLNEKRPPGWIKFIIVKEGDDYRLIGAITINTGGSISFFPDTYPDKAISYKEDRSKGKVIESPFPEYDHMTLAKNFLKDGGHITAISDKGRKKVKSHKVNILENKDYHWLSIVVANFSFLNDVPPEVSLPIFSIDEELTSTHSEMLTESIRNCFFVIEFPEKIVNGKLGCIQIILTEKSKISKENKVYMTPFNSSVFGDLVIPEKTLATELVIKTEKNQDYDVLIKVFTLTAKADRAIYFINSDQ